MVSLIFVVHTALLLGQGQLNQYGVDTDADRRACQNELFRTARIVQTTSSLTAVQGDELENRIERACYNNRITSDEALALPLD